MMHVFLNEVPGKTDEKKGDTVPHMKQRTAIELYAPHAFRVIMILAPGVALLACLTFTIGHFIGFFADVSLKNILILDISGVLYLTISVVLSRFAFDGNNELRPAWSLRSKVFLVLLTLLHWNMITYLIPLRDFWGYGPLFLLISACLLDRKLVIFEGAGLLLSALISWIILPGKLAALPGADFWENMGLRFECLLLTYGAIYVMTRLANTLLAGELESVSEYDPLTRLRNRRSMDSYLKEAASSVSGVHTVAVLDIDDFKAINDSFGHGFGDTVMKRIAEILEKDIGDADIVFRFGGDEFLILFGCGITDAVEASRRILRDIRREDFFSGRETHKSTTVTIGLNSFSADSEADRVVEGADANMYLGKRGGKACIVYPEPDGTVRYAE